MYLQLSAMGRTEAINIELFEPLTQSILTHWNYDKLKEQITILESLRNNPQVGYNVQYEY